MARTLFASFAALALLAAFAPARAEAPPVTPPGMEEAATPMAAEPMAAEPESEMSAPARAAVAPPSIPGYVAGTDLFYGRVNGRPAEGFVGEWSIAGRTVRVTEKTTVEEEGEPIAVGTRVEVIGVYKKTYFDAMILRNRRR